MCDETKTPDLIKKKLPKTTHSECKNKFTSQKVINCVNSFLMQVVSVVRTSKNIFFFQINYSVFLTARNVKFITSK